MSSRPTYIREEFTPEEREILSAYFTNVDGPVFCLVGMSEVTKGALFARYSRSPKSLRRLFLDEFWNGSNALGDEEDRGRGGAGAEKASQLYGRVFGEYGDDSVAQLGFAHLACEQASNILTKAIEWGRLASYLEQSTRYISYAEQVGGAYRYHRAPEILASDVGDTYIAEMDALFEGYAETLERVHTYMLENTVPEEGVSERAWRAATRARALDACRGMLPAGAVSNLGVAASGQAYEQMILRLRAHPLPEARRYAELIATELQKVIPDFLVRIDRPDRGGVWVNYLQETREAQKAAVARLGLTELVRTGSGPEVRLVEYDPAAEEKVVAAILYPQTHLPLAELEFRVAGMSREERAQILAAYVGDRENRRHKPGRAFERAWYEFDILCDYGAFRDLQRHRLCTIEWQAVTPHHGYELPALVEEAGAGDAYRDQMRRSERLWETLVEAGHGEAAQYAVALGYRMRFRLGMNARAAMHICELRSQPQGHISYRVVAQEMARQIADVAGHHGIAGAMKFVEFSGDGLGRLAAEERLEAGRKVVESSDGDEE